MGHLETKFSNIWIKILSDQELCKVSSDKFIIAPPLLPWTQQMPVHQGYMVAYSVAAN